MQIAWSSFHSTIVVSFMAPLKKRIHHFCLRETTKKDVWTSEAKFTHVWILDKGTWRLSEMLSYDHQDTASEKAGNSEIEQLSIDKNVPTLGIGIIENGKLTRVEVYGTLDKQTAAHYNAIYKWYH